MSTSFQRNDKQELQVNVLLCEIYLQAQKSALHKSNI